MSYYYNLYLSRNVCTQVLDAIETAVENAEDFNEIYDLIKLYDHIEDEMEESAKKQDKELRKWIEQQKLFTKEKFDVVFKYHQIKTVLKEYDLDLDAEDEFHLICDLSEVIKNADKNNEQEN